MTCVDQICAMPTASAKEIGVAIIFSRELNSRSPSVGCTGALNLNHIGAECRIAAGKLPIPDVKTALRPCQAELCL